MSANPTTGDDVFGTRTLAANWSWFLLRGILSILIGIAALMFPTSALIAFALLVGAWIGADGVLSLVAGIRGARAKEDRWGMLILRGLLGIGVAVLVALSPGIAALAYAIVTLSIIAFWAILTGGFEIAAAVRLRKAIEGEWLLALSGILSLALGIGIIWLFLTDPLASLVSVAWVIGFYALVAGAILVAFALRLRARR